MVRYCCVPQCKNRFVKGSGKHFHVFPKNRKKCQAWLAILRISKTASEVKHCLVCDDHFLDAMPSVCIPFRKHDKVKTTRRSPKFRIADRIASKLDSTGNVSQPHIEEINESEIIPDHTLMVNMESQTHTRDVSIGTQTMIKGPHLSSIFYDTLDDGNIMYLTGFDSERLNLLLCALKEDLVCNNYDVYLSIPNQLILTLCKLRHNLDYTFIGFMYQISRLIVSKIFEHVIKILYRYLKSIDFWSKKYSNGRSYTAIIDCTEIKTEKSSNPQTNQDIFSHYKNTYTLKYLVAIDEKGLVIFCSDIFRGSTSEKAYKAKNQRYISC